MDKYHYQASEYPVLVSAFSKLGLRRTKWKVRNRDGSYGSFTSYWIHKLQFYHGTAKLDGSLSIVHGAPIYTDEPKEMRAFRWISKGPQVIDKYNMAGS